MKDIGLSYEVETSEFQQFRFFCCVLTEGCSSDGDFIPDDDEEDEFQKKYEKMMKMLRERDIRAAANTIVGDPPQRLPDECPECWRNGRVSKGIITNRYYFAKRMGLLMKCNVCDQEFAAYVALGEFGQNIRKKLQLREKSERQKT